jgi:hypothetical protein
VTPNTLQTVPNRGQLIDEFGELDRRLALLKPAVDRHRELKEIIASWYADTPAEKATTASGKLYTVHVAAAGNERTVFDNKKAFAALKKATGSLDAAVAAITIPLTKAIDKFIPKELHPQFVSEARTGSRKVTAVLTASATDKAA